MTSLTIATITIGAGSPSASIAGVLSLVLFAVVGVIAGPNLSKMDSNG